eukprot:CAMPEP_0180462160 /NCGR_PEP_ID=MMETSP1036_2-20121128/24258_1 /TAXON_ID=632150 /ORGANISM="Azadinium spinosum, Strain 3D9" /LENGTH=327 /DNA_ID=CAMNT_0022468917 /DNA_START=51 /DNA_END=1030 /DNA_ORIENTATION=+
MAWGSRRRRVSHLLALAIVARLLMMRTSMRQAATFAHSVAASAWTGKLVRGHHARASSCHFGVSCCCRSNQDSEQDQQAHRRRQLLFLSGVVSTLALYPIGASLAETPVKEMCDEACLSSIFGDFRARDKQDWRRTDLTYTYGTVNPDGVRTLAGCLQIDGSDVLTDVGSGIGSVVLQTLVNTPVKKVRGIEFVKTRHALALQRVEDYKRKYGIDPKKELLLVNGDASKEDYSDSTIVFASSPCFSNPLQESVRVACEANPNLKYLITQLPLANTKLRYLGEVTDVMTDWGFARYRVYTNKPGVELIKTRDVEVPTTGGSPLELKRG